MRPIISSVSVKVLEEHYVRDSMAEDENDPDVDLLTKLQMLDKKITERREKSGENHQTVPRWEEPE